MLIHTLTKIHARPGLCAFIPSSLVKYLYRAHLIPLTFISVFYINVHLLLTGYWINFVSADIFFRKLFFNNYTFFLFHYRDTYEQPVTSTAYEIDYLLYFRYLEWIR